MLTALALAPLVALTPHPEGTFAVDAAFGDWAQVRPVLADRVSRGALSGADDCVPRARWAVSGDTLYFALEVRDDARTFGRDRTGDGAALVYAQGGQRVRVDFVLADLEGNAPVTARVNGRPAQGVRVAGTQRVDGWAVEAALPLASLPGFRDAPFGLALTVRDADTEGGQAEAVLSTTAVDDGGAPLESDLRYEPTAGLYALYVQDVGEDPEVLGRTQGDLAGDAEREDVVVNARDVVVLGRGLPEGTVYYLFNHGWPRGARLLRFDLMELDGRPGREILLEREVPYDGVRVQVLEVYGVVDGVLARRFAHKLGEVFDDRGGASARSRFRILPGAASAPRVFEVSTASLTGLTEATYPPEPPGTRSYQPLRLPWQGTAPARFKLEGAYWLPAAR